MSISSVQRGQQRKVGEQSTQAGLSIEEQLQLKRVFRLLAFDIPRQQVEKKLEKAKERASEDQPEAGATGKRLKAGHEVDAKVDKYSREMAVYDAVLEEEKSGRKEIAHLRCSIGPKGLTIVHDQLGYGPSNRSRGYEEELIWENNDKLDGQLSFNEFEKSYLRARSDTSGLEPSDLFYLASYLIYDKERSGKIALDDMMRIFFLKYGDNMESEMQAHFGQKIKEGASYVTFPELREAIIKRTGELIDQTVYAKTPKLLNKSS